MASNDDVNEQFEDAEEQQDIKAPRDLSSNGSEISLQTALDQCQEAIHLFFNNQFVEARNTLEPWAESNYYNSLGVGVFSFLQAVLTFEPKDMEIASDLMKKSIDLSNHHRKKATITESFGRMLKKADYDSYTEEQIHAELCYAESLLFKAVLTFTEDETLVSFVKGGLKIRSCYQSYKECWQILNNRSFAGDRHRVHFECGVRLGVGAFNLLISMLPQRILKLLEFIGFAGSKSSKETGLRELEIGYQQTDSIRRVLCAMVLLGYHLIVTYILGNGEGNLLQCHSILEDQLRLNPKGAWFLFFKGRLEVVQAHVDEAILWYEKSWHSQNIWIQFHHMCFWELMWAHCIKLDWYKAGQFAQRLYDDSRWSKCIYAYMRAVFLCMQKDNEPLSQEEQVQLNYLMKQLPSFKQRIAGKSLPMEKFAVKKSARFFSQGERLCLPALELAYAWNQLRVVGKDWNLTQNCYRLVERTVKDIEERKKDLHYWDDMGLATLLKGVCLRYMGSPLQAEECFLQVVKMEKQLVEDIYLIPYSVAELGFLYLADDKIDQAVEWLDAAKNNYKGYSLESRLHFRIHSAFSQIRLANKTVNDANPMALDEDHVNDEKEKPVNKVLGC